MPLTAIDMENKLTGKLSNAICVMTGCYLVCSNTSLPIQKIKAPTCMGTKCYPKNNLLS